MMTNTANLPRDLTDSGLFCCWRLEDRGKGKTKVPYNPHTGGHAQSNNPDTFAAFDKAVAAQGQYDGLGVGIFNGISAIDIDHCVNEDGTLMRIAQDVVDRFRSAGAYIEYSPSGKGVRILFRAPDFQYDTDAYYINRQKIGLEVYVFGATKKYVTVTGNAIHKADTLPDCTAQLQAILDKYMRRDQKKAPPPAKAAPPAHAAALSDQDVIDKAKAAKNGARFAALWAGDCSAYPSQSEADQGLCDFLAFWCNDDAAQMDGLFRQSGLMREKWDRPQSGSTYGAITIAEAINSPHSVYDPAGYVKRKAEAVTIRGIDVGKRLIELKPEKGDRYTWSDMGNGYLFADMFKDIARYIPERKKWYVYDGVRWVPDVGDLRVMALCKRLAGALVLYAAGCIEAGADADDYLEFARTWRKRNRRETILKDATSVYPVRFEEFDADPFVFNCQNGTLNLKTGQFTAHNPADLLSKVSGAWFDPAAQCERWERFIDEVMQDDADKALFLQKAMGYALTGDTRRECFFILYGPKSRNGKGTTMETYMNLMGDYGKSAKPDTIAQKQTPNGSGPSEDIARLAGARFVNISEPDQRLVLSAALVKTLTGNDTITARYLHENSFEYRPAFKLFINTNHLPKVTDVTLFSSGRVKLIPFERHFTPEEQDGNLKTELSQPENLSGILNWCIAGLQAMQAQGFDVPASVAAATDDYRANSDKLGRFLADEMIEDVRGEVRTVSAYQRFTKWCDENGFRAENAANFKQMIENVAEVKYKRPDGGNRTSSPSHFIIGYRLRFDDFDSETVPTPTQPPAQQNIIQI
ncbi:phage/plasmid primase, P4 family [Eubacteriales bacterium OttesenSCG-928-A19]|nr:phage/plasmid primase, P4 family [Eubacteriales bacterium OttesenSCG-928-A19]